MRNWKKCLAFSLLTLWLSSYSVLAAEFNPFGAWECIIPGEQGVAKLGMNVKSKVFSMEFPDGDAVRCPFHVLIMDDEQAGIILIGPDREAHPLTVTKDGEDIIVEFEEIELGPTLVCSRKGEGLRSK